jgi:RNA polymerase sigma-70 factor (ECF subfamily)
VSEDDGSAAGSVPDDPEHLNKLIGAVARRELGAFEQVFTELTSPVYRLALAVVRDPAQAEEIAQEVLAEIWRTAGRFDPAKSSAVAWSLMITRRRAIDRVRSIATDADRERRTATAAVSWDQVSETVQDGLDREQVRQSLGALSDPQRQAILLVFDAGYSFAEAALILEVPIGTVKSRVRAAKINLRRSMGADP